MPECIVLAPNYFPESGAAAKRLTSLTRHLANRGWKVTIVTLLPHHPRNKIYEGYDLPTPHVTTEEEVTVVRLRPWIVPRGNLVARLSAEALFCVQAALRVRRRYDVVVASIPYMFLGPIGLLASRVVGRPFMLDVRDLIWQYPAATGKRTFGLDRAIDRLMKATVRRADALSATTSEQVSYFDERPAKSVTIPNGVSAAVYDALSTIEIRPPRRSGTEVLYAGLIGFNQNLSVLLAAAKVLPHMRFTLVGDGPERKELERVVSDDGLENVRFRDFAPFDELIGLYDRADILVSHVRDHEVFRHMQSAKVWEYMAAGRPLVHGAPGASGRFLRDNGCGVSVPPDDPAALAEAIESLVNEPERAVALARRARKIVGEGFRREVLFDDLERVLRQLVSTPGS